MAEEVGTASLLRFGVFELDLRTGELRKSGKRVRLAPQPFWLLALLAGKPGQLVTREEIQHELWGDDTVVDYELGLRFVVKKARAALGDHPNSPRYIETLPRRGYRFIAPVAAVNHSASVSTAGAETADGPAGSAMLRGRRIWLMGAGLAAIFALLVAFNVGALHHRTIRRSALQIHSIAVLPLQNLSGDPKQEYFAEGMTDELITELSKISDLRVIAHASSMAYPTSKKPLGEIARELNVDSIVEGTVEEAGGRVRINARLVDASTGRSLWAQSYDRDSKDVLSLQSDVAEAIAEKIQAKVTPQEKQRLEATHAVNPAAHDAYLRGRYLFDQRNGADGPLSTQYFQRAISLDPGYAAAYAGLSISLVSQTYLGTARPDDAMPKARAAARHAMQLDPDLGEAYTAMGAVQISYDWDWKAAEKNLRRGIQFNPSDPFAETFYTLYLGAVGKSQQAVVHARRAIKLDPVAFFANRQLASMLYYDRRYNASLSQLQRTEQLQEDPPVIDNWRCWIYDKQGLEDKSVRADLKMLAAGGETSANLNFYRSAYARDGWRGYWKARIHRLLSQTNKQLLPYAVGLMYARLRDTDDAFRWLNRAVDQHSIWAIFFGVDPELDPLRSDPRFHALLRRMHLPQQGAQLAQAMR